MDIGRNSIVIRNVNKDTDEYRKFRNRFSLYDQVYHKLTWSCFTEINDDIYIPASVGAGLIKYYFPDEEFNYVNITAKSETIKYNMIHPPRDELQQKAIEFLMKMKKDKNRERLLSLNTGKGKTYVTINVISQLSKKAMVIVDGVDLAAQWKKEFLNHTDLNESDVVILSGRESIDKELAAENKAKIYIAIHRTLNNLIDEDSKNINTLMNKLKIGVRVFDECHVEYKNICAINSLSNVEYTILLSATPNRSNYVDDSLYSVIFKNIPYFNGKELSTDKYHTVILSNFNSKPPLEIKSTIKTKYGFSGARWANYIHDNAYESFYDHIYTLITKLDVIGRKKKTFIILPTINLIQKMKADLESELNITVGTFIGEIKKKDRFKETEHMLVLTNDKKFDKAIDIEDLEVLINCVPLSSLVKTEQIMGRLRYHEGKSSILIDVTDYGFQECINQLKNRKRFYKKKAKKLLENFS